MQQDVGIGEEQNLAVGDFGAAVPGKSGTVGGRRKADDLCPIASGALGRGVSGGVIHDNDLIRSSLRSHQVSEAATEIHAAVMDRDDHREFHKGRGTHKTFRIPLTHFVNDIAPSARLPFTRSRLVA
jgi:hypothetical protein